MPMPIRMRTRTTRARRLLARILAMDRKRRRNTSTRVYQRRAEGCLPDVKNRRHLGNIAHDDTRSRAGGRAARL
jgi:hypothetical protein